METTVPFWDSESLTIEIIKCDLIHQKLVDDLRKGSRKYSNRSSLHESICWLLGIFEPSLQREATKIYRKERKKSIADDRCFDFEAKAIYKRSKYNLELYSILQIQLAHKPEPISEGIDRMILNLIQNDLIHTRLIHELNNGEKENYRFCLVEPILWLCGHWDIKLAKQRRESYKKMKNLASEMTFSKFYRGFTMLTKETFLEMKKTEKKSPI